MKSIKKTSAVILTVALGSSIALAGCSNSDKQESQASTAPSATTTASAAPAQKVTIDFWSFWGSETRKPVIQKIVDDFNKSQDKIEVKYTYLPWGDIWTKNLAAIAAGSPPDVIINDIRSVGVRAENNQNTDLADLIKNDSSFNKDQYFENLWKTVLYKGDPYALPFNTDTRILFYNKDQFKEAGLDPNKPPQTWDELLADAKILDQKDAKGNYTRVGFNPNFNFGADNWMLNADGGKGYFDDNGKPIVNTPAKIDTLNWLNSWTDRLGRKQMDAFKAAFGDKTSNPFISGKVSMYIDVATFYTQIEQFGKDLNVGFAAIPEYKQGSGHWSSGGGFVAEIPKGSKHEKEAYEFMKYLTGKDAQAYWGKTLFDNIANKEASNSPDLQAIPVYKFAVDNMKDTVVTAVPNEAPDYGSVINPEIDKVLLGKESAKDGLDAAQKNVENMISQHK